MCSTSGVFMHIQTVSLHIDLIILSLCGYAHINQYHIFSLESALESAQKQFVENEVI